MTPAVWRRAGLMLWLSGAAGLAHQLLWTRRMVDLLGAGPDTFAQVIGGFFLGLSAGCAWAGLRPCRPENAWRRVRNAEVAVAGMALLPLGMVEVFGRLGAPGAWVGEVARAMWPLVLVGLPAAAMGVVLPAVLCLTPADSDGDRCRVAWLYGLNTLGGIAGIGLVVFVGLPWFGLVVTALGACGLNLVVAAMAGGLRVEARAPDVSDTVEAHRGGDRVILVGEGLGGGWAMVIAAWSGFGVLGLEVVLQHQFAQVAINSHFSAATVLVCVLGGLVGGAWVAGRVQGVAGWLAAAGLGCAVEPLLFHALHPGLVAIPYDLEPARYVARLVLLGMCAAVPVFGVAGVVFPGVLRGGRGAGRVAALLAINGVGGWLGAELCQTRLLPRFGLWGAAGWIGCGYAGLAVVLFLGRRWRLGFGSWVGGMGSAAVLGLALASAWVTSGFPQVGRGAGERVVEVGTGREGVVATVTGGTDDWRMLFNNTYTLGGSRAAMSQERQALLPVLMQGRARRVALLGLATGSTTAGAALGPAVEEVEAFELSPIAAGMARRHFGPWNRGVLEDPRVRVTLDDARLGMLRRPAAYDVVVGDLFLPWRTGEGRLYALEHFRAVRRSLRSGGLYCQWLPLFQLTRAQFEVIGRTFARVFPGAFLVRGDFYADLPIVGLCAFEDGRGMEALDWDLIEQGCRRLRVGDPGREIRDALVRHPDGVAMCLLGPLPAELTGAGPINTLANSRVEWDAGRNIIGLREPWFIGVPWAQLARDIHRVGAGQVPGVRHAAHDAGQFFLTLEIAALSGSPVRANLEAQVGERLPPGVRLDAGARWEGWPARVKIPGSAMSGASGGVR